MNPSLARAAASPARAVSLQQNKFDKTLVLHVLWLASPARAVTNLLNVLKPSVTPGKI